MSVQVKHDKYEAAKVNFLFRLLQNATEQGRPIEYEILIDDFVVVPRNSDPDRFNSYADCISSDTKTITVVFYKENRGFDKYFFSIERPENKKQEGLGEIPEGLSLSEWEERQKNKWKKELRYDELEKENTGLQKELEEKDKAIKEYAEKFSKLKEGKLLGISEIGTSILMGFLKHPKVQENFPVLNGFADGGAKTQTEEPASFTRKGEKQGGEQDVKEEVAEILTEEEQGYLRFVRDLEQNVTRPQFDNIMHVLEQLVNNPAAIGSTLKHISNFLNSKPKEDNEKV